MDSPSSSDTDNDGSRQRRYPDGLPCCFYVVAQEFEALKRKYPKHVRRSWKVREKAHDGTLLSDEGYMDYNHVKKRMKRYR